jgi:hypothetical protein
LSCTLFCLSMMYAAEAPLQPVTVCEVLKEVMVVGRFSFRKTGRWLSEETCEQKPAKAKAVDPIELWLAYDPKAAPKPSPVFEIDAAVLKQKMKLVKERTTLREFRFGSADYDRWAAVFGRVEKRTGGAPVSNAQETAKTDSGGTRAPAQLLYCGDGVIVFLDNNIE